MHRYVARASLQVFKMFDHDGSGSLSELEMFHVLPLAPCLSSAQGFPRTLMGATQEDQCTVCVCHAGGRGVAQWALD